MQNRIATDLATDQSLVLSGPGVVKVKAVNTVSITKLSTSKTAAGKLGSTGFAHLGPAIPALAPILGFAALSVGAFLLVKMWMKNS